MKHVPKIYSACSHYVRGNYIISWMFIASYITDWLVSIWCESMHTAFNSVVEVKSSQWIHGIFGIISGRPRNGFIEILEMLNIICGGEGAVESIKFSCCQDTHRTYLLNQKMKQILHTLAALINCDQWIKFEKNK